VGGGIVWDSTNEGEYQETLAKTEVLTRRWPEFSLLETMAWQPGDGYLLLNYHIDRLLRSADYFGIRVEEGALREALAAIDGDFSATAQRVRVLVARNGSVTCESSPLTPPAEPLRVAIADEPVSSSDLYLYHKTTHRDVYDTALAAHPGADDVILYNEKDEITESCYANVVVELDGERYTPPVPCGLLAGTYRQWMLDQHLVEERIITREDLERADRVWLVNSVRGEREVQAVATHRVLRRNTVPRSPAA
jgi:para-aminobenzoate synthetase/4-amino-4-deoxychorismate lyase